LIAFIAFATIVGPVVIIEPSKETPWRHRRSFEIQYAAPCTLAGDAKTHAANLSQRRTVITAVVGRWS